MTWPCRGLGDGARCAPSWRLRADWIPAYAGMTGGVGSRFRGNDVAANVGGSGASRRWGYRHVDRAAPDCFPLPTRRPLHNLPSFPRRRESSRRDSAMTRRNAPRHHAPCGATSFPRKREPTPPPAKRRPLAPARQTLTRPNWQGVWSSSRFSAKFPSSSYLAEASSSMKYSTITSSAFWSEAISASV